MADAVPDDRVHKYMAASKAVEPVRSEARAGQHPRSHSGKGPWTAFAAGKCWRARRQTELKQDSTVSRHAFSRGGREGRREVLDSHLFSSPANARHDSRQDALIHLPSSP